MTRNKSNTVILNNITTICLSQIISTSTIIQQNGVGRLLGFGGGGVCEGRGDFLGAGWVREFFFDDEFNDKDKKNSIWVLVFNFM